MCLSYPIKINLTDYIICYKVCVVNSNNEFVSPWQKEKYILGALKSIDKNIIPINPVMIEENAFHSFSTIDAAMNFTHDADLSNAVIIKCIIPKNSNYTYKGTFQLSYQIYESYASEKIIPISVIYPFHYL